MVIYIWVIFRCTMKSPPSCSILCILLCNSVFIHITFYLDPLSVYLPYLESPSFILSLGDILLAVLVDIPPSFKNVSSSLLPFIPFIMSLSWQRVPIYLLCFLFHSHSSLSNDCPLCYLVTCTLFLKANNFRSTLSCLLSKFQNFKAKLDILLLLYLVYWCIYVITVNYMLLFCSLISINANSL